MSPKEDTPPTDLETFIDLNGFSQIYDNELDTTENQQPLMVYSQENNMDVDVTQVAKVSDVGTKEKEGKLKPSEVFGKISKKLK